MWIVVATILVMFLIGMYYLYYYDVWSGRWCTAQNECSVIEYKNGKYRLTDTSGILDLVVEGDKLTGNVCDDEDCSKLTLEKASYNTIKVTMGEDIWYSIRA